MSSGKIKAIGIIMSIKVLPANKRVVLISENKDKSSIIKNTVSAVPEGAYSISMQKSLIFLNNIQHLAITYYHIELDVVHLVW